MVKNKLASLGLIFIYTLQWSYGVLLWELFTRGSAPYSDIDHMDMREYLEAGNRLKCPDQASQTM